MLEKILVQGLLDQTFKKKIDINKTRCLRASHEKDKCQKCFDTCPEKAISLREDTVYIDPLVCTGCNHCVSTCYSRALQSSNRPYLALINKALDENSQTFSLGCMETKDQADINFGCLRTVDPRFFCAIFAADLKADIKIGETPCESCSYKDLGLGLQTLIADLKVLSKTDQLKISLGNLEKKEDTDLSRRDLFKNIFKTTEDLAKSSVRQTTKDLGLDLETEEDIDTLIKILLKKALKDGKDLSSYQPYIYSLEGSPACNFCSQCQRSCPQGAIKIKGDQTKDQLVLDQGSCTYCGRCLEKFPTKALSKTSLKDLDQKILYQKTKDHCKSCKATTSDLNEEGLCPTCALRRKNRRRKINRR